eukprot:6946382-Karenia_brevis.AAC.1
MEEANWRSKRSRSHQHPLAQKLVTVTMTLSRMKNQKNMSEKSTSERPEEDDAMSSVSAEAGYGNDEENQEDDL